MIDMRAFLTECRKPYTRGDSNCATSAHAALGAPPRLGAALQEWRGMAASEREAVVRVFASDGELANTLAERHGLKALDPHGEVPAWGVVNVGGNHSFAVRFGRHWWARSERGARRAHVRYVVGCWEVA